MLNQREKEFVKLVLEVGSKALDQDTFEFMMKEGVPVNEFSKLCSGYNLDEVVQSLEEKELANTESQKEIIRTSTYPDERTENKNWNNTEFKTVDRQCICFTEELESLYNE